MRLRRIWGFTLIELLVVISIIATLMAILMPALGKAKEQGKQAVCMANLHSIGHSLYIYAHDNRGRLIAGDFGIPWDVWAYAPEGTGSACVMKYKQVNLGHLLSTNVLPMPADKDHVFFCPSSSRAPDGRRPSEAFIRGWGSSSAEAPISYMFNDGLDGFDSYVPGGSRQVLSHRNRIIFLLGDGSVDVFRVKPLVFADAVGLELLQEVSARYGVCFPSIMLHRWLEHGEVDLAEAREYLANPTGWFESNNTGGVSTKPVLLASVGKRSLVCDVVGVWGGQSSSPEPPPG